MYLIFGENLGLMFSSHSLLKSSCPLSVLSWLWMNLSLTVCWLFNSWPMVIWDDLFPNFTDGILGSLKIVCFWDYSKWSGHMLVLSLFLFLLPENKLAFSSLLEQFIFSMSVNWNLTVNSPIYPNLGASASQPQGCSGRLKFCFANSQQSSFSKSFPSLSLSFLTYGNKCKYCFIYRPFSSIVKKTWDDE